MRPALAALAAFLVAAPFGAAAQDSVRVLRAGPGRAGVLLRQTVESPHRLILADTGRVVLARGTTEQGPLLILGGDVGVGARVNGDVTVVGGDLYMHPGGEITGNVLAIGGCIYSSSLATISGETECVREALYDVRRRGTVVEVTYRPFRDEGIPVVSVPFPGGIRVPTYTRVDGLGLQWGPRITFGGGSVEIDPTVTYRSATGELDPQVVARTGVGGLWFTELRVGRDTRTNDAWIRSEPLNSLFTLVAGRDARNYYRSRYATLRAGRRWERGLATWSAWVGGQFERDRSTVARAPWSFLDRRDSVEGMSRPNPSVAHGDLGSGLIGFGVDWEREVVRFGATVETEFVMDAPDDANFVQTTAQMNVDFQTFGAQRLRFELHAVHTAGDEALPQRFAYLGGSGTLPTLDLLSLGGDQLLFVESRYDIPIERLAIPVLGPPIISLRHMMGSAGVDSLPDFTQNVGVRLALNALHVDLVYDPKTDESELTLGVGLGR